ncbi:MAG: hypothetical protein JNK15_09690 [Planctomycetes bacterium]|nr:hypothetical protein [Planctomycetota bacterium]
MNRPMPWVGPLLLSTVLAAQQGSPETAPKPATAAERLAALQAEQKQVIDDYRKAMAEAAKKPAQPAQPGQAMPAMRMRPSFKPLVEKAKLAAKDYAGTEDAVPFLLFQVQNAEGKNDLAEPFDTLLAAHVDSPKLAELGGMLPFLGNIFAAEKAQAALERLGQSKDATVRGFVLFTNHKQTIETADVAGAEYGKAKAELLDIAKLAGNAELTQQIDDAIGTREKFGIGVTAPDIAGEDLDGVAFKLSDYKGKVVFLDFWGDW